MRLWYQTACVLVALTYPMKSMPQSEESLSVEISLELNTIDDTGSACRFTFVANNQTGTDIDKVVYETVVFDNSGSVAALSLFDFRDLPSNRPRVRQFDVSGLTCDSIGQALINGANTCTVNGSESSVCKDALNLSSRIEVDLLG